MSMTQPPEGPTRADPGYVGDTRYGEGAQTAEMTRGETMLRGETTDSFRSMRDRTVQETKLSFLTTELWLTLAGIAALIVTYNVSDEGSFDLWRMTLLSTILGAAYVVSRGFAKSGSPREHWDDSDVSHRRR